jgi:small subunit ribosomal protein S21
MKKGNLPNRGGVLLMVIVKKMPGDSDDALIRKFSRKVLVEGILQEAKRRKFYLKPSLARKQKKEDARRAAKRIYG